MNRDLKFRGFVYSTPSGAKPNKMRYESNDILFDWHNEGVGVEIMQFTGIKDKNGKDIYEGDILKTLHFIESNKKKHYLYHKVEWCERLTGWQTVAENQDGTEQNGNPQLWVYVKNNEFEVVGNIYEHANLLKREEKIKEKTSTP